MAAVHLRQRLLLGTRPSALRGNGMPWRSGSQMDFARHLSGTASRNTAAGNLMRRFENQLNRKARSKPMNKGQGGTVESNGLALDQLTRSLSIGTHPRESLVSVVER